MRVSLTCAVIGALCIGLTSTAAAQIVSPAGDIFPGPPKQSIADYEGISVTTGANAREVNLFGRDPALPLAAHTTSVRFEQVDGDITGFAQAGKVLTGITWRRDGHLVLPQDLEALPRVIRLHVTVGLGTYNDFGPAFGQNFEDQSWVAGYPRTVIGTDSTGFTSFSLPDLTTLQTPPGMKEPWIVTFPFEQPYFVMPNPDANYDSLIWSLRGEDIVTGCYPLDMFEAGDYMVQGAALGTGCIVGTHSSPMTLRMLGTMDPTQPTYKFTFDVDWGPASSPLTLIAGIAPTSIPSPLLCTNLFVQPDLMVPFGSTNVWGNFDYDHSIKWDDDFEGLHLYTQMVALDPDQRYPIPVALTNGVDLRLAPSTPKVKSIYAYGKDDPVALGGIRYGSAVVTRFEDDSR